MMRTLLRFLGWMMVLAVVVIAAGALWLAVPGTPQSGKTIRFTGYTLLPKSGVLNVLDYLTIDDGQLYAGGISSGAVYKVPLAGGDLGTLPGSPAAHGVVIDPVSHMGFVTRSGVNTVEVFDPATLTHVATLPAADDADGIFYDPKNKLVYVASGDAMTGTVIDPASRTVVGTIALGGKPEFAQFDPQTGWMMQNLESTDEMLALDLATRKVVHRWPLTGCKAPSGLAIDAAARQLYVACSGNAAVALFDLNSDAVTSTEPIAPHTDTLGYDAGLRRLYAAGATGTMTVTTVAGAKMTTVETIHTHLGAHTLAIDPASHRVYLGYAGLFVAPRLAVFEAVR